MLQEPKLASRSPTDKSTDGRPVNSGLQISKNPEMLELTKNLLISTWFLFAIQLRFSATRKSFQMLKISW